MSNPHLDVSPQTPVAEPIEQERTGTELVRRATIVLHNDDVNSMDDVVHALLASVPELSVGRAVEVMLTAHSHGQADVITCPLERAELYRDRLASHHLTATIRRE
ncbi:MAG: ATP-dependent Clp protease adaptor ClpS [Dehalococcoidia bacterium]|nr:ATP-dependent Clp protease adaptor ClpS [Dehalococcoidia bacterium]